MAYAPSRARDAALLVGAGSFEWLRSFIASYHSDAFEFCQALFLMNEKMLKFDSGDGVGCDGAGSSLRERRAKRGDAAIQGILGQRGRGVLLKNRLRASWIAA
jgi:hypothetical protein